jgi:putative colanic acid biosynthesis acetyltransferase WcaF
MRFAWNIFYFFLFIPSPRSFHSWRIFLLKLFGAKIGKNCKTYRKVKIWAPWNLRLGNYVMIADNVNLYNMDIISIDDYAIISDGAYLCSGSHDYNSKNFQLFAKPIVIKKKVWICAQAFIHPGITIGEGCVVGARSVVIKNLTQKNSVYSGNPCRFIKKRKVK